MTDNLPQPDDARLGALLRDVKLPDGLLDRLKSIPLLDDSTAGAEPQVSVSGQTDPTSTQRHLRPLKLVASLAASLLLLVLAWQLWKPPQSPHVLTHGNSVPEIGPGAAQRTEVPAAGNHLPERAELAHLDLEIETLNQAVVALELRELERKRDRLQAAVLRQSSAGLPPRESASLVLALGCRSAHELGVSARDLAGDLAGIESRFAGTPGAELARQLRAEFDVP